MTIGAVIVTFNPQLDDLKMLLSNIENTVKQIVFVDNGSNNIYEIKALSTFVANLSIIELGENKGIGFAQNRGIDFLFRDISIDAFVLFDHDSHPEKEMIPILANEYVRMTNSGIHLGALGPVFYDPRTNNQYPISIFKGFSLIKKYAVEGNIEPIKASVLIASGSFIPKKAFEVVGGMNEDFFIDYIDMEWSFRSQHLGYQLFVCPQAKMAHQVGDARMKILGREISVHSPLRRYYLARNSVFMIKTKYINWQYKVREIFFSLSRVIIFLICVNKRTTYLKYILQGWRDGLINKKGICTIK